ncbi:MAG: carbohydrate kinase family protein [Eubacteriales bacterium]|nr:carbohydrate kinase family protein [Eubacteriales bacterium]
MAPVDVPAVVVAGHICLDITPALDGVNAGTLESLLRPGKLVRVGAADVHTGGCVANTGMALQLLGVSTRLIARVGADAFGALVRKLACASGAECALTEDAESATSYSIVLAPPNVDRIFLHHAGANERFTQADVPDAQLAGARLLHFGYPSLMPHVCRDNGAELYTLFSRAKSLGLMTSMDMAAIDPHAEAAKTDWSALLQAVLPQVDCFLPSAEEVCFMLDRPRHAEWLARANGQDVTDALDIHADVAPLAETLLAMGAKIVLIKCGARGIYYRTAAASAIGSLPLSTEAWADREGFQPAYRARKVVSATGAGDASIAAFLASLLERLPPETCVSRAAAEGACCVEVCDALSGLLPFAQLDRRLADGWKTN